MAGVSVNTVPSPKLLVTTGGGTTKESAESHKAKTCIAELESVEAITVGRHEELLHDVRKRHAEEIGAWKENSAENADSLNSDLKVANADSAKKSGKRNLILSRFEEHVRALHALVNDNLKRKVTLIDVMARVGELHRSGRSINKSNYSVKIENCREKYSG